MFLLKLLEFRPFIAIILLEVVSLILVIMFAGVFKKAFEKLTEKSLICFFIVSRLLDMSSTVMFFKKLRWYDPIHETSHALRWFLANHPFSDTTILIMYNVLVLLVIFLFLYKCWRYSKLAKLFIEVGVLAFSVAGILIAISNIISLNL